MGLKYSYVTEENGKFQVYIWLEGMKFKLDVANDGLKDKVAAEELAKMASEKLNIDFK